MGGGHGDTTSWEEGWMMGWSNAFGSYCFPGRGLGNFNLCVLHFGVGKEAVGRTGVGISMQRWGAFMFRGINIASFF
jgi:hypothetical protein